MNSFKRTLFVISFLTNFFLRFGIFLILGIVLCLIGTKVNMSLAIGLALIVFDLIVSVIETFKRLSAIKSESTPIMKDLNQALDEDNDGDGTEGFQDKYGLPVVNSNARQTNEERYLRTHLDDGSTVEDCVRVFREMCEMPLDDDLLLFECNSLSPYEERFMFSLVRQYPDGEGEYYQLRVLLEFEPDNINRRIVESKWSDTVPDFWQYIENSKAYKYACNHKAKRVVIMLEET